MIVLLKLGLAVGLGLNLCGLANAQVPPARQQRSLVYDLNPAAGQAAEYPNLKKQAQVVSETFVAGDYKQFVTLLYPKLVQMAGGPDALIDLVSTGIRDLEAKGFKVISYAIGEPATAVRIGQGLYAVVPTKMRTQSPHGVIASESFMIGISSDGGENWTFIGGAGATDEAQLRAVLPEVIGKLTLPEKKQPTLERKQ